MTLNTRLLLSTLLSLISGVFLLIYLNEGTLFLAALLLVVVAIKTINTKINADEPFDTDKIFVDSFTGLWFALSIAPAFGIQLQEIQLLSNGFLIQALLSFIFFILFFVSKISIIGRITQRVKGGVGIMASALIAGAAAGISSSALWQLYLKISQLV